MKKLSSHKILGSGNHGTTKGCLAAIKWLAGRTFYNVLDVGCGTGILSKECKKIFDLEVFAVDHNPKAVEMTGKIFPCTWQSDFFSEVTGAFGLILFNVDVKGVIRQVEKIKYHLGPAGIAIISGFEIEDLPEVKKLYESHGFKTLRQFTCGPWATLIQQKGN